MTGRVVAWVIIAILGTVFSAFSVRAAGPFDGCMDTNVHIAKCPDKSTAIKQADAVVARYIASGSAGSPENFIACPAVVTDDPSGGDGSATAVAINTSYSCAVYQNPYGRSYRYYPGKTECQARPDAYAGFFSRSSSADVAANCKAGCEYEMRPDATKITIEQPLSSSIFAGKGSFKPSGKTCSVSPEKPDLGPVKNEFCHETRGGYTVCTDASGRQCVTSSSSGRKYCSAKGQEQNATDPGRTENVKKKADGTEPGLPENRIGEDWKAGDKVTTSTTTNSTTSTSITNINVNGGVPNNTPGSETPGDGSGDNGTPGKGDGEDDEGEKGEASGSGSCDTGWSCSGDSIGCAQLTEMHENKCAITEGPGDGVLEADEGEADTGIGSLIGDGESHSVLDVLGSSINTTKACPVNPVIDTGDFGTIELPLDKICPHLQLLGTLLLGFAYLLAVKVMLS